MGGLFNKKYKKNCFSFFIFFIFYPEKRTLKKFPANQSLIKKKDSQGGTGG